LPAREKQKKMKKKAGKFGPRKTPVPEKTPVELEDDEEDKEPVSDISQ
jgi:hypothetical protein